MTYLLVLGIAAFVVAVLLALLYLVRHRLRFDFDFNDVFTDDPTSPDPFPQSGALPMSSSIDAVVVRWHQPDYYWRNGEFWKTFADGPWKWDAQQRYAGKGHNCGHFFSLTEAGATAEAEFYGMDATRHALMRVDLRLGSVLDLTYEQNLIEVAKLSVSNLAEVSDRHFLVTILSWLTDAAKGGTGFTDFVGHWAARNGYDGILFFGARALRSHRELYDYVEHGADDGMMGPVVHGYLREMRKRRDLQNLVVLSGHKLTASARTAQLPPDVADPNPFFGADLAAIDALVEFKLDYQEEHAARVLFLSKPFTIE